MKHTPVYEGLTAIFKRARKPQAVGELLTALYKSGLQPNKTTVYRQLEKMESEGLVRRVNISDTNATYEAVSDAHHHHLVCERCGEVRDIVMKDESHLLRTIAAEGFAPKVHKLEIFGLCKECGADK